MAALSLPLRRPIRTRFAAAAVVSTLVLLLVVILVVWPLVLILLNSFQTSRPGQPAVYSLETWRVAFSDASIISALANTALATLARVVISLPLAVGVAWLLARTDIPGTRHLEFMFWVAFFLPALPVTLGWILLLDPQYGLINQQLAAIPFIGKGPFNIYSFWGIVWVHLASTTVAVKVMLLTPAFRNLDASLEEASAVCGSSTLGTIWRIVVPAMLPAIVISTVLSIIHALQSFEVETILGPPFRFFVFSTKIYTLIAQEPPLYASATALSTVMLGVLIPLIILQRWTTERRSVATVSGQYRIARVRLDRWRIPAFLFVLTLALITTVVPSTLLLVGTFMRLFGFFDLDSPWTTANWGSVVSDPIFLTSVRNTLVLAFSTAVIGMVLCTTIAYITVRTHFSGARILDVLTWLPSTLPGIILSLGLLWFFLGNPLFRPFYGTMVTMIVAAVVASLTLGVQTVKTNLAQFGRELEEAARVGGGGNWDVARHVIVPLLAPVLFLVGTLSFVAAARNVSTMALLATSNTRPLSLLQLDYMVEGRYEAAAVVGVLVVLLTCGVAVVSRILGLRLGIRQ
jgi:iron(III) transport system permease protein